MIDDVFDDIPVRAGREDGTRDITKTFYVLGDIARFWGVTTEVAELIIKNAPEGRGKEWLSQIPTEVLNAVLTVAYFPGVMYLGTQVRNSLGDRFIVHLCEVILPRLIQDEPKSAALPVISTANEASPFPAIRALVDEAEHTREIADHAHQRIDVVERKLDSPTDRTTARKYAAGHGLPTDLPYLKAVGCRAADLASGFGIREMRIDHDHFPKGVHTWPNHVWDRAFEEIHDDEFKTGY